MDERMTRDEVIETVESAVAQLGAVTFRARGRKCQLAHGPERLLLEAIYVRLARWIATTGADPVAVDATHRDLLACAPALIGETQAATIPDKKAISKFAHHWNAAFGSGRVFLGAPHHSEPRFDVRLWIKTGNGVSRFWFDIAEHQEKRGSATQRDHAAPILSLRSVGVPAVPLKQVVRETTGEPQYEAMAERIVAAAASGSEHAKRAAARVRAARIVVLLLTIGVATFLAKRSDAQQWLYEKAAEVIERIKNALHGSPAGTTITVPGHADAPDPRLRVVEMRQLPPITVTRHEDDDIAIMPATYESADIYVSDFDAHPGVTNIDVTPSPEMIGVRGRIEIDFGDGSAAESKMLPILSREQQRFDLEFTHTYAPGRRYTLHARVFRDDERRLYEVISRTIFVLPADVKEGDPMPYPYHPFDEKRLKDRAASESSTT